MKVFTGKELFDTFHSLGDAIDQLDELAHPDKLLDRLAKEILALPPDLRRKLIKRVKA